MKTVEHVRRIENATSAPYVAVHGLAKKYGSSVAGIRGFGIGGPTSEQG